MKPSSREWFLVVTTVAAVATTTSNSSSGIEIAITTVKIQQSECDD